MVGRVAYRSGFVKRLDDVGSLPAITIEAADLPEDVPGLLDRYILDFGSSVTGKPVIASSANTGDVGDRGSVSAGPCGGTPEESTCPAGNDTNHVMVRTYNAANAALEDHGFYVAVFG